MRRLSIACAALLSAGLFLAPAAGQAQIYKYKKPDGSVVYTDKLSDLPSDRRAHYNRMEKAREQKREALENRLGKEELEKREAEAERQQVMREQMAEAERQRRMAAIDATLERIRKRQEAREAKKATWQKRMKDAKDKLAELLGRFREAKKEHDRLAMKPSFTYLPGEADKRQKLAQELEELEKNIDLTIHEVYVVIPDEARKAGIPPGWLR